MGAEGWGWRDEGGGVGAAGYERQVWEPGVEKLL